MNMYGGVEADSSSNVMAQAQKPDFVFRRNRRVHLNRRGRQFSRLLAAEVCASTVVMLDAPCSEVVWRVLATHSIRQFSLHFPHPCVTVCHHISTGLYNNARSSTSTLDGSECILSSTDPFTSKTEPSSVHWKGRAGTSEPATMRKIAAPARNRTLSIQPLAQSLYWLSYAGSLTMKMSLRER